jgi:UDP-N-acetylmuramoyl-tripeptide--D-alanyl-D-alanine ligase
VTVTTQVAVAVAVAGAITLGGLRWFRVAQREHYGPGRVRAIAGIWLGSSRIEAVGAGVAVALAVAAAATAPALGGVSAALAVPAAWLGALIPWGLAVRGRTSKLAWTGRLRRLAVTWAVLVLALGAGIWWALGVGATALVAVTIPLTMDAALWVMERVERRLSAPFVAQAQRRLARVRPKVVAVTGSYGKTSTKGYIAHLLSGSRAVVASPASFNNRLGLSRAINDHLVDGTEVFVAEMGTYGPGEIRELCRLFPPDIAVITTIGEAHLERMRNAATVLAAKSEITERAPAVVLPIDNPGLAALADRCEAAGKRVIRCSVVEATAADVTAADVTAAVSDVVVDRARGQVRIGATTLELGDVPHGVNLAVALGVVLALDVAPSELALESLPRAAHRAEVYEGPGVAVIDDTYNANPIGAHGVLAEAAEMARRRGGPLVVVSPGMVELGPVQRERNAAFGKACAEAGAYLIVVGRTNRAALVAGARAGGVEPELADHREQAVPRAMALAADRGVVLYENDLPDQYP